MGSRSSFVVSSAAPWVVVSLAAGVAVGAAESPTLRPGRYEVTYEIELPGLSMAPRTDFECVTPEMVRDVRKVLVREETAEGCSLSELVTEGARATFLTTCADDDGIERTSLAELEIGAETYAGVLRTELEGRVTVVRTRGRRVGECGR